MEKQFLPVTILSLLSWNFTDPLRLDLKLETGNFPLENYWIYKFNQEVQQLFPSNTVAFIQIKVRQLNTQQTNRKHVIYLS